MFVPIVPNSTVVNKNIVYSDTVLSLKDTGKNIKVTCISDVSQTSLEKCLETVFKSNSDVIFNTVQYSVKNKKVYFYTDTVISTKEWEDSKSFKYRRLLSSSEILEEVKRILVSEKNEDEDCVSLYEVARLMKVKKHEYENLRSSYQSLFKSIMNESIIVYNFNYNENELDIGLKFFSDYKKISFSKQDGDLFITKSQMYGSKDVLAALGDYLSKLYDEFMDYRDFKKQFKFGFNAVNSNFLINVSDGGVSIFVRNNKKRFTNDFELTSCSFSDTYKYDCNSNMVISAFRGNEDEVFKRIFVKISDCPSWSQSILYEFRRQELAKIQNIKDKSSKNESVKKLTKKIFSLFRK